MLRDTDAEIEVNAASGLACVRWYKNDSVLERI
jgi:hypothetical protein